MFLILWKFHALIVLVLNMKFASTYSLIELDPIPVSNVRGERQLGPWQRVAESKERQTERERVGER